MIAYRMMKQVGIALAFYGALGSVSPSYAQSHEVTRIAEYGEWQLLRRVNVMDDRVSYMIGTLSVDDSSSRLRERGMLRVFCDPGAVNRVEVRWHIDSLDFTTLERPLTHYRIDSGERGQFSSSPVIGRGASGLVSVWGTDVSPFLDELATASERIILSRSGLTIFFPADGAAEAVQHFARLCPYYTLTRRPRRQ